MTKVFKRIRERKVALGLSWEEIAQQAGIKMASWMTGLPTSSPTDAELKKLAPVLKTTYSWLKYGDKISI